MTSRTRSHSRLSSLARAIQSVVHRLWQQFSPRPALAGLRFLPEPLEPRQLLTVTPLNISGNSVAEGEAFALTLDASVSDNHLVSAGSIDGGDDSGTETVPFGDGLATAAHTYANGTTDWGDGGSESFTPSGDSYVAHTYGSGPQQYYASLDLADDDDAYGPFTTSFQVDRVTPLVNVSGPPESMEGQAYDLHGVYSPTGNHNPAYWSIDWGDGSPVEQVGNGGGGTYLESDRTFDLIHTYTVAGDYAVHVSVTDDTLTTDAPALTAHVIDLPGEAHASGVDETDEGATYTLHASDTDPGDNAVVQWEINWGDGSALQTVTASGYSYSPGAGGHIDQDVTHVFPDGDTDHAIAVTAVFQDGTRATDEKYVHVRDVPATFDVSLNVQGTVHDGSLAYATLSVSNYHDVPADPFQNWSVDWGDGNVTAGLSSAQTAVREFGMAGHYPALVTTNGGGREVVGVDIRPGFDLHSSDDQVLTSGPSATLSFGNYEGPGTLLGWHEQRQGRHCRGDPREHGSRRGLQLGWHLRVQLYASTVAPGPERGGRSGFGAYAYWRLRRARARSDQDAGHD